MRSTSRHRTPVPKARVPAQIAITIASDLANVRTASQAFREFLHEHGVRDDLGLLIVFRELLMNAILYGNKHVAERRVYCRLSRLEGNMFEVQVEDEGKGFDYRKVDMNLPEDPRRASHRGYALIRALADRLEFSRKGNRVSAYFTLDARRSPEMSHRAAE